MPYIPPQVVQEVKRMDLLTYLKNYEPYELLHFSGNTYTTRTHDSLKISNGKWMWWSRGIGGRSALDYLIKVRDYSFLEAVELLAGQANIQPPLSVSEKLPVEKHLLLPKENRYHTNVFSYLTGRGIDNDIVRFCIETGRIYESAYHHNAIFVGMDQRGKPQYAALRGINTDFIGEANGSDKNYSFSIPAEKMSNTVHVFESAIDLLSYATMQKLDRKEWRTEHLLSLAGVYQPAKEIEKSKVPAALTRFLTEHSDVKEIVLHLDNDRSYRQKGEGWVIKCKNQIREEDKVIFPEGSIDFGMAHGIIGVALFLSKAYSSGIIEQKQEEVIKEILQIYEKVKKQGIDGRYMYPSQLSKQQFVNREWDYDIRNNRMSWCYGTIGILRAQFLIGEYINNCKITNYCVKEIMKITHVDIKNYKLESPIICHGYAGVAVILDAFNRKLKCKQIEKRVEELMNIVYGFFNPKTNYGYMDRGIVNVGGETYYEEVEQFDLFSGSAGIILAIAAIMNVGVMWEERIFVIK